MTSYTYKDRGCWADGTFGDTHVTETTIRLAIDTVEDNPGSLMWKSKEYYYLLEHFPMRPDSGLDYDKALSTALEVLNSYCWNVHFSLHEGDLILSRDE